MNKRTLAIMESVMAQRALTDTDNELRATVTDYDAKMAYHAELMARYFQDTNPMTHPDAQAIFEKIGIKMKARFGND